MTVKCMAAVLSSFYYRYQVHAETKMG